MKELREFNVELKRELTNASDKFAKYRPKKFLGQNFLVDENIAKKIVASLDIQKDDYVIEIGPGQSSLTKYLITLTNNFVAIELDKHIVEKLRAEGKIDVIHKDFLDLDFDKDIPKFTDKTKKLKIIGNIPYNITLNDISEIKSFTSNKVSVKPFPVIHKEFIGDSKKTRQVPALGFKFTFDRKKICYGGDTAYCEELVKNAKGADLAILEAGHEDDGVLDEMHMTMEEAISIGKTAKEYFLVHVPE